LDRYRGHKPKNELNRKYIEAHAPNLRKIGQKLRSLLWTNGIADRHTDRRTDIHSSDFIFVECHASHLTDNNRQRFEKSTQVVQTASSVYDGKDFETRYV